MAIDPVADDESGEDGAISAARCGIYVNRMSAIEDVRDYIDSFYNPVRRHRHLGGVSPDVFEANAKRA